MIQIFFNSVVSALMLALVALGFNLIFNATRVFHLAHGAIYVTGVFFVYTLQKSFAIWLSHHISYSYDFKNQLLLNKFDEMILVQVANKL